MQVLFKSRHPQATELRDLTERRVCFVLRRLSWLVPRAEVHLSDMNGPRGGVDKRCQVELKTDRAGSVVVASVAKDWRHRRRRDRWLHSLAVLEQLGLARGGLLALLDTFCEDSRSSARSRWAERAS